MDLKEVVKRDISRRTYISMNTMYFFSEAAAKPDYMHYMCTPKDFHDMSLWVAASGPSMDRDYYLCAERFRSKNRNAVNPFEL